MYISPHLLPSTALWVSVGMSSAFIVPRSGCYSRSVWQGPFRECCGLGTLMPELGSLGIQRLLMLRASTVGQPYLAFCPMWGLCHVQWPVIGSLALPPSHARPLWVRTPQWIISGLVGSSWMLILSRHIQPTGLTAHGPLAMRLSLLRLACWVVVGPLFHHPAFGSAQSRFH